MEATQRGRNLQIRAANKRLLVEFNVHRCAPGMLAERIPTYVEYAVSGMTKKIEKDLPIVGAAKADGAELWSIDDRVRKNAGKLGVKIIEESFPAEFQVKPRNYAEARRLLGLKVIEITPEGHIKGPLPKIEAIVPEATPVAEVPRWAKTRAKFRRFAGVGGIPEAFWFGILVALDIAVSSYVRERERLRMARDWSSILPKLKYRLSKLQDWAYLMQTQNPLDFVFANVTVEVVWHRYFADGEKRHYRRTELKSVDVSTVDKYEETEEERGGEFVLRVIVSNEFFELTEGLIAANLETVRFLEDTEIREWLLKNKDNLPAVRAIPTQEKIRLIDRLISGDFWAIWCVCSSVTNREEASDIEKQIEPITADIGDKGMQYRVRSVLMDMRRGKVREYSTY